MRTSLFAILLVVCFSSFSQEIKTYNGNYLTGKAIYKYYENENYERIKHGSFSYTGDGCLVSGNYANNKREGKWTITKTQAPYTFMGNKELGFKSTLIFNCQNDELSGEFTFKEIENTTNKILVQITTKFANGQFSSHLSYTKILGNISLEGDFDGNGYFNGTWILKYQSENIPFENIRKYINGVLFFNITRNVSTGEIQSKYDDTKLINDFYANLDASSNISIVNGVKYTFCPKGKNRPGYIPYEESVLTGENSSNSQYYRNISMYEDIFTELECFKSMDCYTFRDGDMATVSSSDKEIITFHPQRFITVWSNTPEGRASSVKEEKELKQKVSKLREEAEDAYNKGELDKSEELFNKALSLKYDESIVGWINSIQSEKNRLMKQKQFSDSLKAIVLSSIEWINVEGGSYEKGCDKNDFQTKSVKSFSISKFEITVQQYKLFCQATKTNFPYLSYGAKDNNPIEQVSWFDAQKFAEWLGCRLPTEIQWEFAAYGGINAKKRFKYSGSNDYSSVGWFKENSYDGIKAVGQLSPNSLGIYDMTGNVSEWTTETINGCENNNNISGCPISKGGGWSFYGNDVQQICERKTSHPNNADGIGIRLVK